jgi:hypothetical protein
VSLGFLNIAMLAGLLGISLPFLAHLLSKKKYDRVDWGAMQFLEMSQKTRRRIRLEEILLMLLRMGLIVLIAIALARPWLEGGFLAKYVSTETRDVVFVVDGSYSMGWEGKAKTPHVAANEWAHRFLGELTPGDAVALLDARDQVRPVVEQPSRDGGFVRDRLNALPPPTGSSNLAEAAAEGVRIASRSSNVARDVVILTDGQARGWRAGDGALWARFDDQLAQAAVRPRVWVVDVAQFVSDDRANFSLESLVPSRELTVPDFPVRFKTKVRYSGGKEATTRKVWLEIDGQRLADKSVTVRLEPNGEASVEFEYRFTSAGSHLVTAAIDADNLPGDNRADCAISVTKALPVLLVDGAPSRSPVNGETFFARAALSSAENDTPWIRATSVDRDRLDPAALADYEVLVLANVRSLRKEEIAAIRAYVASGGGLLIALGDAVDGPAWNDALYAEGRGLLPAQLGRITPADPTLVNAVTVRESSLDAPWLQRFKQENGGGLATARFDKWWTVALPARPRGGGDEIVFDEDQPQAGVAADDPAPPPVSPPLVDALLNVGDPLLVSRRFGAGRVMLLAAPLDADWGTLPAKEDYVPLLHEVIFQLAGGRTTRNVDVGLPLTIAVEPGTRIDEQVFVGPGETEFAAEPGGTLERPLARLTDTRLPGVYTFRPKDEAAENVTPEHFVVNFDRGESDLTPLTADERALLEANERMTFVDTVEELKQQTFTDTGRTEVWQFLLLAFVGLLCLEVWMTRRLVQGGHMDLDELPEEFGEPTVDEAVAELERAR